MKTGPHFNDTLKALLGEYSTRQQQLDDMMARRIDDQINAEKARLLKYTVPPVDIGTRVWSSNYKRHGTVIKAELVIDVSSDDYYAPWYGPDRYSDVSEWSDDDDDDNDNVSWLFTVRTDPSPVKGNVSEYTCCSLINQDGSPIYRDDIDLDGL